jgi:hypothetical protein
MLQLFQSETITGPIARAFPLRLLLSVGLFGSDLPIIGIRLLDATVLHDGPGSNRP